MTIRKSLTAFIVTGFMMGVASPDITASMQEEEEMEINVKFQYFSDAIEYYSYAISKAPNMDENFIKNMKKSVQNIQGHLGDIFPEITLDSLFNENKQALMQMDLQEDNYMKCIDLLMADVEPKTLNYSIFVKHLMMRLSRDIDG